MCVCSVCCMCVCACAWRLLLAMVTSSVPPQGIWVRYSAVGFLCTAAQEMDDIDMECYVMPKVVPYLQHTIIQLREEVGGACCRDGVEGGACRNGVHSSAVNLWWNGWM